jgi:O-antigen ligase
MKLLHQKPVSGILHREKNATPAVWQLSQSLRGVKLQWSFVGLYIFTLLLYVRPSDWVPGLGSFPLVKIITVIIPLFYLATKISLGEQLTIWPIELKMLLLILGLAILFIPFAQSKEDSLNTLSEPFIKIVIIFTLLINVIDSRERLRSLLKLIVMCGTVISAGAIRSFLTGQFNKGRIEGIVGGMFQNANDLATAMNILLPIAVVLALTSKGLLRLIYFACAAVITAAIIVTFSRAGYLGLGALTLVMFWKLRLRHRVLPLFVSLILLLALLLAIPGGPGSSLSKTMMESKDKTESVADRNEVLMRGIKVAISHPLIGVGMGNFYLYSRRDLKAHNSYLEIWAELGLIGLAAYLTLLIAPLRSLKRIVNETYKASEPRAVERFYLSLGLQATIISYIVCSAFSSIQYLWFVYFPVAFAIALRGIHANSSRVLVNEFETLFSELKDKLWEERQPGILWGHTTPANQDTSVNPKRLLKTSREVGLLNK